VLLRFRLGYVVEARKHRFLFSLSLSLSLTHTHAYTYLLTHPSTYSLTHPQTRMFLYRSWYLRFKSATRTIENFYFNRCLFPKLLRDWYEDASVAAKQGDAMRVAQLVECLDEKYSMRLGDQVPNLVNRKDRLTGQSLLHFAAQSGDYTTVRFLLLKEAWPNEIDMSGRAPIHDSCEQGDENKDITALLLETWSQNAPSFYSYDITSPRAGSSEEMWRKYHKISRQEREKFDHPRDMLEMVDSRGMGLCDIAVNSSSESSRTVEFLNMMGVYAEEDILNEKGEEDSKQYGGEDSFNEEKYEEAVRIRIGEEKRRRAQREAADPLRRLVELQQMEVLRDVEDPVVSRMRAAKMWNATKTIQKVVRGYMSRRHQKEIERAAMRHRQHRGGIVVDEKEKQLDRDTNMMIERLRARNVASRARDLRERLRNRGEIRDEEKVVVPINDDDEFVEKRSSQVVKRKRKSTLESDLKIMNIMMKSQTSQYLPALRKIGLSSVEDLLDLTKDEFDSICEAVQMKLMDRIRLAHALRDLEGNEDLVSDSLSVVSGSEPPGITIGDEKMIKKSRAVSEISVDSKPPGVRIFDLKKALKYGHTVLSEALDAMNEISTPTKKRGWFYLDKNRDIQGPFARATMRNWYFNGYLDKNLCVRYGDSEEVAFQRIKDLFRPSENAFAPLCSLKTMQEKLSGLIDGSNGGNVGVMKKVEGTEGTKGREFLQQWLGMP